MARTGIQRHYVDAFGRRRRPPASTIATIEAAMRGGASPSADVIVVRNGERPSIGPAELKLEDGTTRLVDRKLPADLPHGYHQIKRKGGPPGRLIVAPFDCYLPTDLRGWGWAIQLYAARSRRSWGIGDLAALRRLGEWGKEAGASFALISPLSAPTPLLPQQASPYFPSTRLYRNPLFLSIEEVPGAREIDGFAEIALKGRTLNRDRLIDRDAIFRLKMSALETLWSRVRQRADDRFERFVSEQGAVLWQYAMFCALSERFGGGWHAWPANLRHPDAPAVRRASRDESTADRIRFHQWVQYQLDRQLARASAVLPVMQDLPIGFDADGADGWAFQDALAHGISVGAPPDEFNTRGQNWGLPPFVPGKLRAAGYEPFIQTIRACLRHAGGLRIDHVMGLFRLFWIPFGAEPAQGALRPPAGQRPPRHRGAREPTRARGDCRRGSGHGRRRDARRARRPAHPFVQADLVREGAPVDIPRTGAERYHHARPADSRRALERIGLRGAARVEARAERGWHTRDPRSGSEDDARHVENAGVRGNRPPACFSRDRAVAPAHGHSGRCDGGRRNGRTCPRRRTSGRTGPSLCLSRSRR